MGADVRQWNLKRLLLYKEKGPYREASKFASIADNMHVLSEARAKEVSSYLKNGLVLMQFLSSLPEPYRRKTFVPAVIISDGEYLWDGVVVHWVEKYRVRLPEELLSHIDSVKNKSLIVTSEDIHQLRMAAKHAKKIWVDKQST